MVKEAPKGSYLNSVLELSKKNDNGHLCTFTQELQSLLKMDFDNTIILVNDLYAYAAAFVISYLVKGRYYYIERTPLFRSASSLFFIKDIDPDFLKM